jgi:LDH2 family malate/lactate/ureidoglycolate dehydrogenase
MANELAEGDRVVRIDDLQGCLAAAFERLQLERDDAAALAGLLVDSELRGHVDHGVAALGLLSSFYRSGKVNPRPRVKVLRETGGAILLDGDRGCGPGMAVATVRDWQLLVAAPYVRLAAEAGLIGFACTNYAPLVAPPGSRTPVFGTNPFAYGLPAGRHPPVVLDVATTVTSMQKVRVAAQQGTPAAEGTILDRAGRAITDPAELFSGGSMTPLGYPRAPHKGFGLALWIDALAGVLSGAGFARGVESGTTGNFLWALDIEAFLPRAEFNARMDAQIDQIKGSERLPGVEELFVPGERGQRRHQELTSRGSVPIGRASWEILAAGCRSLGVALPTAATG